MFKFTFNLGTNALSNPFSALREDQERTQQAVAPQTVRRKLPAPPRRPSPPLSTAEEGAAPRSRKRGWVPTSSSASEAISQPTLTNGWMDTPAKYLGMASVAREEDTDSDLPAAKRRRTLTDSIISTAFSAALIGTAVGLTAYRMWRDRGKSPEESAAAHMQEPPPPYQRDEWSQSQPASRASRNHKKTRSVARRTPRHRRALTAVSPTRSTALAVSYSSSTSTRQEERGESQGDLEDKMDLMGDKIRQLISDGQRALGKEIVIKTDEQNNEEEGAVDDGMEGWEEENGDSHEANPSPLSSMHGYAGQSPSVAFTSAHGRTTSPSFTSPRPIRLRHTDDGGQSKTPPRFGFPYHKNGDNKLGSSYSGGYGSEVFRETVGSVKSHFDDGLLSEDEDSRQLARSLDAFRKAYNIR